MTIQLCRTNFTHANCKNGMKKSSASLSLIHLLDMFRKLPQSTQSVLKRTTVTCILLGGFFLLLYGGPPFLLITTLLAQLQCFKEIIAIPYNKYEVFKTPGFRHNTNYFMVVALLYFWCDNLLIYYHSYANISEVTKFAEMYYKFICLCLYFIGVIWFVVHLKRKHYRRQFGLLAWTHVICLIVIAQSCLITKIIYQGIIWFVLCIATITSNDIMAYICGKLFGKTPLIALSPKKTWEGFIGAGIFTILIGCTISYSLLDSEEWICPIEYGEQNGEIVRVTNCDADPIFKLHTYELFGTSFELYPIMIHSFFLALFGSIVAPFGGFFASGFKRACNIKDFGVSIPGHGGIMDRFDCQLVMIVFLNVYISTFVGRPQDERNVTRKLFQRIMNMTSAQQVELFHMLAENLQINN